MSQQIDDFRSLVRQVCDGSEEAARKLVEQYGSAIRRAVRRALDARLRSKFDSLDFVQVVWNSFFRAPEKLDQIKTPGELAAYLLSMARHKVNNENRRWLAFERHNISREQPLEALKESRHPEMLSPDPSPMEMAIARECWDRILEDQPGHYRQILELRLSGHTYQSIAATLNLDKNAVRRILGELFQSVPV